MKRTQVCVYVLLVVMKAGTLWPAADALPEGVNCERVRYSLEQKGIAAEVPRTLTGAEASICGTDHCCTADMTRQLSSASRLELNANHTKRMSEFGDWLQQRADKFDDVFREMLNSSKQGFHAMFTKTYGIIYEQHSYVFTDLFKELEKYYTKGNVDLTDTLDDFFNTLYQKMFTVLNAGYRFNDKYLECINERMKELKPFGDVPGKLTTLLRRSFYATRTFSRGLHVAAKVIRNMQNVTLSESCHTSVAKMFHCSVCSGYGELLPCNDYCTNVSSQCYAYHMQLDYNWKVFINATDKVIERLLGSFNIEMVIIPIDIKISEAIMIFQENAQEVSQRVFSGCGKPELGRNKRANGEIEFETLDFSNRGMGGVDNGRPGKGEEQGKLERVIRDTRLVLRNEKDFWKKLPSHMCEKSLKADTCWDGKSKVKSPAPSRPTRIVDPQLEPKSLVNEQVYALKSLASKLTHAYNGVDEDWIDSEDMDSGSGSGSGSGIDLSESGSGDSPTEIPESPGYPAFPTHGGEEEQGEIGGGGGGGGGGHSDNKEPNEIAPIPDLSRPTMGNNTRSRTATASATRVTVTFSFVLPIIMVSFGNTLIDWIL